MFWAFRALVDRVQEMQFTQGANSFEVAPNFSLRALKELHIDFTPAPPEQRPDPAGVQAKSQAADIGSS